MTKILVMGAGVSGLTCAVELARQGHEATVWAKDMPEDTTSAVAAAYWAPYACNPQDKVIEWSRATKKYLEESVMPDETSGVRAVEMIEYFDHEAEGPWWRDAIEESSFLKASELPDGYKSGFKASLLLIDTTKYLPWLVRQLEALSIELQQHEIQSFSEIPAQFEVVINCTGLGSRKLCRDERLYPVRGQVVVVESGNVNKVFADDVAHNSLTYIIPRYNDTVLGGTAQANDWNLTVNPEDTREIIEKAQKLIPGFKPGKVIREKVGLRPYRDEVRLELEITADRKIVHNYGHGGAGYTLSWGCATDVAKIVKEAMA